MKYHQIRNSITEIILFLGIIFLFSIQSFGQSKFVITKDYDNLNWNEFISKVESNYNVHFFYEQDVIPIFYISIKNESTSLKELLINNLNQFNILVSIDESGNIFLTKENFVRTKLLEDFFPPYEIKKHTIEELKLSDSKTELYLKTTDEYIAQTMVIGSRKAGVNKDMALISGYVKNVKTGESIIGATIMDMDLGTGVATNEKGFFQINITKGKHILTINSVNTVAKSIEIEVLSDGNFDILVEGEIILLDDVGG